MTTLLSVSGVIIGSAAACKLLEYVGQGEIAKVLGTVTTIAFFGFLGVYVTDMAWNIINMFGGLPK